MGELAHLAWGPLGLAAISSSVSTFGGSPSDLFFALDKPTGWTDVAHLEAVNDIGATGGSIAGNSSVYGVAWVDLAPATTMVGAPILYYTESSDALNWLNPEQVYGFGSGGWEPSLAYNPNTDEATVAYYVCSSETGAQMCPASQQGLYVSIRRAPGIWDQVLVDPAGGRTPVLNFDNNGNMVIVYRDVNTGGLRIAKQTP
jgi:hypothetical protein